MKKKKSKKYLRDSNDYKFLAVYKWQQISLNKGDGYIESSNTSIIDENGVEVENDLQYLANTDVKPTRENLEIGERHYDNENHYNQKKKIPKSKKHPANTLASKNTIK